MTIRPRFSLNLSHPGVVGIVHSFASLAVARKLKPGQCDWLELRLDAFHPDLSALRRFAPALASPRIVTVRLASQGGMAPALTAPVRRALYADFLEVAALVDIDLRASGAMKDVIRRAKAARVGVILSFHDFLRTPRPEKLRELARRARDAGADVFKVAATPRSGRDLAALIDFLADEKEKLPLAVMGMGAFGKVSRLVLAQAGSCLNYGYLRTPNATGQWPAAILKARIAELQS
jgi:3-dehydroquinate dehydratase-1